MTHQGIDLKALKLKQAQEFHSLLGDRGIRFIGVSGSVSYEPAADDDIDIFVICESGSLWKVLFRAFFLRRRYHFKDICLSLAMDENFASSIFCREAEYVVAEDSVHVVPLYGGDYYSRLLASSPFIRKYFPKLYGPADPQHIQNKPTTDFLNLFLFAFLGSYLYIKSWRECHYLRSTNPERAFDVKIGLGHFYFDTVKYRKLKIELRREET